MKKKKNSAGASSQGRHQGSVMSVWQDQRLLAGSQLLLQAEETLLQAGGLLLCAGRLCCEGGYLLLLLLTKELLTGELLTKELLSLYTATSPSVRQTA